MSRLSRLGYIDTRRTQSPPRRRVRSRGVPPALESREIFYTEDVAEAEKLLAQAVGPVGLAAAPNALAPPAIQFNGVRLRDISLLYLDLHVETTLELFDIGPYYLVMTPMNATASADIAGRTAHANTIHSLVFNPGNHATLHVDHDAPLLIIRIELDAMEQHLMRMLGRTLTHQLSFEHEFDLTTEAAMRWHGAVQLLHTEVFYEGSITHAGRGIGSLEDFLMSSLVHVHASTYSALTSFPSPRGGRRAVRRSMEYIEAHLSEPISMADLAQHIGASVRSIQQGFRDELSTTPLNYLRDRRLERARQELMDSAPSDGLSVTAVAEHWGFNHLGNFAVLYKNRYGESPSETLRR